ncbi:NnrU family protein [Limnohabitans sp. B9-3]|uniref:NnrU family protein n=1 Tax=Limnohabitans sp. B9-3 TaxID=1100707 RepID=UPI000C1E4FB8|nr:NnrU family protein [Limnohabitans sp. B9-3]PIT77682.1 protein NrnU [Limnohabitans sp. B9-3]
MAWLILGLVLFLGAHSTRIFAEAWRTRTMEAWGEKPFKGVIALVSLLGFYALIVGYAEVRMAPVVLWQPPIATRHISVLLMLFASILLVAANIPANHFKVRLGHPMVLSVKVWALAHLLSNGNLADVILFGAFLAWSVMNFKSARSRDRASAERQALVPGETAPSTAPKLSATLIAVVVGVGLWALITFVLHAQVVGVSPLG